MDSSVSTRNMKYLIILSKLKVYERLPDRGKQDYGRDDGNVDGPSDARRPWHALESKLTEARKPFN